MIQNYLEEDRKRLVAQADEYGKSVDLEVFSGRVVSKGEHQRTTRVTTNKDATVVLQTTPEIWVQSAEGKERRFVDTTVAECRADHSVTLIISLSNDAVLSMKNQSTKQTWFAPELTPKSTDGAYFWLVGLSFVLSVFLSFSIVTWMLGDALERNAWWAEVLGNLLILAAVLAAIWLPERSRRKHNFKVDALRGRIGDVLEDSQPQGHVSVDSAHLK